MRFFLHVCICNAGLERCSRTLRSRLKWMLIVQSHVAKVQSLLLSTCCNSSGSSLHVTAWKDQLALSAESNLHLNWNCSSQVLLHLSLFFLRGHPLTFRGNSFAFFFFFFNPVTGSFTSFWRWSRIWFYENHIQGCLKQNKTLGTFFRLFPCLLVYMNSWSVVAFVSCSTFADVICYRVNFVLIWLDSWIFSRLAMHSFNVPEFCLNPFCPHISPFHRPFCHHPKLMPLVFIVIW